MANPRRAALLALYEIEYNGAFSNMAVKECLAKNKDMSSLDKRLVTALVYGTVKRKITLDYVIKKYSSIKLKKISPYILLILRLGIFQIMFMDKIPDSAAVDESVKLAKRYGHKSSAGFVNAVLHSVIRGRSTLNYPKDKAEFLAVKYSFPSELVERWIECFGEQFTQDLLSAMNKETKICVRVNTLKTTAAEVTEKFDDSKAVQSGIYENALYTGGFDVSNSQLYKDGMFTPQDIAAMTASVVLSPKSDMYVMDLCAAPGGKSTHMAELMYNKGHIISFDIHEHKIKLIEANAQRLGIDIIEGVCADSTQFIEKYRCTADRVLADVPCSGTGIIRKKPDIKYSNERVPEEIQYKILENAAEYLKNGGELVYSTCSIEKRENEDIVERFLAEHKEFETVDFYNLLPDALKKDTAHKGYITFYPNTDNIDGFFIAKMRKK